MKKESTNKTLILSLSIVAAALIIAVAFNLGSLEDNSVENTGKVYLPSYLAKETSVQSEDSYSGINPVNDSISFASDESDKRLLTVSGTATLKESPDKALIVLSVVTVNKNAAQSQQENAELSVKVRTALKNIGLSDESIKTVSYNLREKQEWNENQRKYESIGFETVNSIQVTVNELNDTGKIIDAAVEAGANSVSSVSFALSDEKQETLMAEALKQAALNARKKAESISEGLSVSLGSVYSASENTYYSTPYYRTAYDSMGANEAKAETPVTPGDIEFNATVSVQFEII